MNIITGFGAALTLAVRCSQNQPCVHASPMSLYAAYKFTKLLALIIIASTLVLFLKAQLTRTKVLLALWLALALAVAIFRALTKSHLLQDYQWVFLGLLLATPIYSAYWLFATVKDWATFRSRQL